MLITGSGDEFTSTTDGTLDLGGAVRTIHVDTTTVGGSEANANATIETRIINGGIVKTGPRILYLNHPNNTFAGGLQIDGGSVVPGGGGSLGTGPVTFGNSGGSSALLDLGTITGVLAADFTIGGSGSGSSIITYSGLKPSQLELSGTITLERDLTFDILSGSTTRDDSAVLYASGLIDDGAGSHGLVKIGNGTVRLAAGNTFSGGTTISKGILEIPAESALGDGSSALVIDGGCLHPTASFALASDVVFGPNGGNIRVGDTMTLDLTGDVSWGSGTSAFHDEGTTVLSGPTTAGSGDLWIGAATEFAEVYFNESLGLGHVLSLRGSASLPSGNLRIVNNSILELGNGDFTRPIGTGPGELLMDTNRGGGWAAFGADRAVNLGGAGASVLWGGPFFLYKMAPGNDVGALILGSDTATHTVDFQNALDLDTGESFVQCTVLTNDGLAALDAEISGDIVQTQNFSTVYSSLTLGGDGTLEVSGSISGPMIVMKDNPGTVILSGTNDFESGIEIEEGILTVASDASLGVPYAITVYEDGILDATAMTVPVSCDPSSGQIRVDGTLLGDVEHAAFFDGNGVVDGNLHTLSGGRVEPDFYGKLLVTGDLTLDTGSDLRMYFYGPVSEQDHTVMQVAGAVDLSGSLTMDVYDVPPLPAGPFVLICNDGSDAVVGTFDGIAEGATVSLGGGLAMQVTYVANGDGGPVGNDVAVTFVADPGSSDLSVTATAPLIVDLGAPITVSYVVENLGPADVTDGFLDITLPPNAGFVGSTPAGSLASNVLSVPLPVLTATATTTVELDLTAPASVSSVTVYAEAGSGNPDPVFSNNSATVVTAVLPDACLQLSGFSADLGSDTVTLTIDTLNGVTYMLQSSIDLEDWEDGEVISGYDYPYDFEASIDETREFFRIIIIPYTESEGGGGES